MPKFKPLPLPLAVAISAHLRSLPPLRAAEEVARLLRVDRKTLCGPIPGNEILGGFWVGRCLRFRRDAVLMWLSPNTCAIPNPERNQG